MDFRKALPALKACVVFPLLLFSMSGLKAQTWTEFTQQKKTQKRYFIEQLIALKIYAGYLDKGYRIAGDGIEFIKGFKDGEFGLHELFFGSLKAVNPLISGHPKLASLLTMEQEIFRISNRNYGDVAFGPPEIEFIESVKHDLKINVETALQTLSALLEAGKLEMSEEERFKNFQTMYDRILESYRSATDFDTSVKLLRAQKNQALREFKKNGGF
ncbi:hypothetical protein [Pedobacter sp. Leaf194]|uniref:hypothetical protein n=1 Tax=Pedobacter sp. Leaf194 TaxID=1736297 RepID=UPI0007029FDB|nr:hypothetical protein [Pedobacter sp. Leaf194]KQS36841.1 hypothetical protein ASG14_07325 [Pedobacter sp. Leaf194]